MSFTYKTRQVLSKGKEMLIKSLIPFCNGWSVFLTVINLLNVAIKMRVIIKMAWMMLTVMVMMLTEMDEMHQVTLASFKFH